MRHDLRLALRALGRRPGYSALAILTLAVGLGVNTVAFSAVSALLYKPVRMANARTAGWLFVGSPAGSVSLPAFETLERASETLDLVAAEGRVPLAVDLGAGTEQAWALIVSPDYFSIVPTRPITGRTLGPGDRRSAGLPVMVSERFWRRRLDGATALDQIRLALNGQQADVVGVVPDEFQGPGGLFEPDLWVPLEARRALALPPQFDDPESTWLTVIAKPRAGAGPADVRAEVVRLLEDDDLYAAYVPFGDGHPEARSLSTPAAMALGVVGIVLLIACFNVAGLILARSMERRRDLSVRAALGATRWRLARQLLTEGLVFASAAAVMSVVLASWSATLLSTFSLPAPIPQRLHFQTDWRLIAFASSLALVAAIVPALAPVWQVARTDLARWVRVAGTSDAGAFSQRRARRAFVLVQVAGSTFFLVLALTFGAHFVASARTDPGFDTAHTAALTITPAQYGYSPAKGRSLVETLMARLEASPGVDEVAVADRLSFYVGYPRLFALSPDGSDCEPGACVSATTYRVGPDYFRALGIPILGGRSLEAGETAGRTAIVLNATAAEQLWPGESAIGRAVKTQPDGVWREVVGVAGDVIHRAMSEPATPTVYLPFADEDYAAPLTIVARSTGEAAGLVPVLRAALRATDDRLPADAIQTMSDRMALPLWAPRTTAGFFGISGVLAVLLSTVGLFGVMYFTVNQRRREFGVRFALGASARDVRRLVLSETLRLSMPGVLLGSAAALAAGLAVGSRITGVSISPAPFALAIALQAMVTLLAAWSPARRAATANPLDVLRSE